MMHYTEFKLSVKASLGMLRSCSTLRAKSVHKNEFVIDYIVNDQEVLKLIFEGFLLTVKEK